MGPTVSALRALFGPMDEGALRLTLSEKLEEEIGDMDAEALLKADGMLGLTIKILQAVNPTMVIFAFNLMGDLWERALKRKSPALAPLGIAVGVGFQAAGPGIIKALKRAQAAAGGEDKQLDESAITGALGGLLTHIKRVFTNTAGTHPEFYTILSQQQIRAYHWLLLIFQLSKLFDGGDVPEHMRAGAGAIATMDGMGWRGEEGLKWLKNYEPHGLTMLPNDKRFDEVAADPLGTCKEVIASAIACKRMPFESVMDVIDLGVRKDRIRAAADAIANNKIPEYAAKANRVFTWAVGLWIVYELAMLALLIGTVVGGFLAFEPSFKEHLGYNVNALLLSLGSIALWRFRRPDVGIVLGKLISFVRSVNPLDRGNLIGASLVSFAERRGFGARLPSPEASASEAKEFGNYRKNAQRMLMVVMGLEASALFYSAYVYIRVNGLGAANLQDLGVEHGVMALMLFWFLLDYVPHGYFTKERIAALQEVALKYITWAALGLLVSGVILIVGAAVLPHLWDWIQDGRPSAETSATSEGEGTEAEEGAAKSKSSDDDKGAASPTGNASAGQGGNCAHICEWKTDKHEDWKRCGCQ